MDYELRPVTREEVDAFLHAMLEAFHEEPHDEDLALWRRALEVDRTLAAFAGGEIVATSGIFSLELTVPGAVVPTAGVTVVGVQAVHRGRGLLDRMMRGHLEAVHERGQEPVAALWASEGGIYGRYGYGVASRVFDMTVRSAEARLRVPLPERRPRAGTPAELLDDMRTVYERVRPDRPGLLGRDDVAWDDAISDFEHHREGAGRLRALAFDGDDGPTGYAIFAVKNVWTDNHPQDVVELRELVTATPEAAAALWHHLLGLRLTRTLHWEFAAGDESLPHLLVDPRAVGGQIRDAHWVRLVDVPRALAARTYSAPIDAVLEVTDDDCPWNRGRWRLEGDAGGARCEPTTGAADLALSVVELGAAYLGGTSLAVLADAGRAQEHTPGALDAAARAFRGAREPWALETF
jgi:predicted acetyltransferase